MTKIELIYTDFILLSQWLYPQIPQIPTDIIASDGGVALSP
jgi:hypothetical protein